MTFGANFSFLNSSAMLGLWQMNETSHKVYCGQPFDQMETRGFPWQGNPKTAQCWIYTALSQIMLDRGAGWGVLLVWEPKHQCALSNTRTPANSRKRARSSSFFSLLKRRGAQWQITYWLLQLGEKAKALLKTSCKFYSTAVRFPVLSVVLNCRSPVSSSCFSLYAAETSSWPWKSRLYGREVGLIQNLGQ